MRQARILHLTGGAGFPSVDRGPTDTNSLQYVCIIIIIAIMGNNLSYVVISFL